MTELELAFNELSRKNIADDTITAEKWLEVFFNNCLNVSQRTGKNIIIITAIRFSEILFSKNGFSFQHWLSKIPDKEKLRRILSMLTRGQVRKDYPYYYLNGEPCQGLGYAYENSLIAVSYPLVEEWDTHFLLITCERFNVDEEVIKNNNLPVNHVASDDHLNYHFPERKFVANKKHDPVRPLHNKDEEVGLQECSDEEAQMLLNNAIGAATPLDKKLYNFDSDRNKYIIFRRHESVSNEYHCYHIHNENEIPANIKGRLKS
jgi:hypothetical protein